MNINTKYIQFSGKAEVANELKVGSNYEIVSQGTIVSSTIHDNDNGTVDVSYKWRVIMSEITDEKGESIKAKDTRGNSTLIRNQAYAIWREYSTSKDFETFYNELTREYMKQADVIAKKIIEMRKKKSELKKLQDELWELCKQITRRRYKEFDDSYRCFTCGAFVEVPHTGHIITDSTCSTEMSYSLDNLRLQCYACNIHKSGNWQAFYQKLGEKYIDNLIKRNNESKGKKYDILWYKAKVQEYKALINKGYLVTVDNLLL